MHARPAAGHRVKLLSLSLLCFALGQGGWADPIPRSVELSLSLSLSFSFWAVSFSCFTTWPPAGGFSAGSGGSFAAATGPAASFGSIRDAIEPHRTSAQHVSYSGILRKTCAASCSIRWCDGLPLRQLPLCSAETAAAKRSTHDERSNDIEQVSTLLRLAASTCTNLCQAYLG